MALVTDELSGVLETSPAMSALDVLFVPTGCRGFSRREFGPAFDFVDDGCCPLVRRYFRPRPNATPLWICASLNRISELGEWFHNLNLHGVPTAPHHFLGDFPNIKWCQIEHAIPQDLRGATVLDVGCNAGFYSIEMKRRGARRVLGIDVDERYLKQARFAADTLGVEIELQKCSVYETDQIPGQFDYVFFMG